MRDSKNSPLPKVVILLAAFNGVAWLTEQVKTILAQVDVDITLYISVDQSTDGTERLADELALRDSRIRVLPHHLHFGGAAANFYRLFNSVDFSNYAYVALSDQDDIWNQNKLAKAIWAIKHLGYDAYSSNVTAFWSDGSTKLIDKAQKQVEKDYLFEAAGPGCTYVITKSLAIDFQNLIHSKWENVQKIQLHDWLLYAFARSQQYKWLIDPEPSLLYRQHSNNQVGANVGFSAFIARAKKVLSGWGLTQATLIANLIGVTHDKYTINWAKSHRLDYMWLGSRFWKCRRRLRDKLLFLLACTCLAIFPPKIK